MSPLKNIHETPADMDRLFTALNLRRIIYLLPQNVLQA